PALTQVDYAEIWDVLQSANWALIVAAFLVGHAQFLPQATATMFAVPARLPFWPLLTLQTASQFISLAIPSAAGRVAMNAAFLHKFGVSITTAVAQGAIDGFSGFLVQAAILIFILLTGDVDLGLDIEPSEVPWLLILGGVALLLIGVVVAVLRVRKLRDRIVPVVRQAWGALMVVLRQPVRAIGLLGSNFVYWNLLGLTLWLVLHAVGADVSFGTALFVAAGTSLFAGFMPVPGGVGVAEATMTALLVTFGVDEPVAFAVTMVYRLITFYLPALEGLFGTRWLERNEYI
ncbi:MAG: lysylphosphatidylglycerol synthase transmembrane domain-containing protein, partial [Acidimicrobiia bacterium]